MQTGPISVILLAGLSLTLPGVPAIGFTPTFSTAQSTMDPVTLAMSHMGLPTSLQTVLPSGLPSLGPRGNVDLEPGVRGHVRTPPGIMEVGPD